MKKLNDLKKLDPICRIGAESDAYRKHICPRWEFILKKDLIQEKYNGLPFFREVVQRSGDILEIVKLGRSVYVIFKLLEKDVAPEETLSRFPFALREFYSLFDLQKFINEYAFFPPEEPAKSALATDIPPEDRHERFRDPDSR